MTAIETTQPQSEQRAIQPSPSTEELYQSRADRFKRDFDAETERWNRIGNVRLLTFFAAAAAVLWAVWQGISFLWALGLALFIAFVLLVRYHNSVGSLRRRHEALWKINTEALARLARHWVDFPSRHTVQAAPDDPYAADLDIFGRASLFHLLDTVGTTMGENTLSHWLQTFAPPEVVRDRQRAVAELAPMIDLRDELTLRGRLLGDQKPDPEPFVIWAEGAPWLAGRRWLAWVARLDVVLLWALLLAQIFGFTPYPLWLIFAGVNIAFTLTAGRAAYSIFTSATSGESGFRHYADSFELLSKAPFAAPILKEIQEKLAVGGVPAHKQMRRLHKLTTFVIPPSSQLYIPIQALTLWDLHLLRSFEVWQGEVGRHARAWLDALGEVEALSSLATLYHDNPFWVLPSPDPAATSLMAEDLGHPLIAANVRITNGVTVGPPGTFLLVTGSNMSGKSTLLRAIGVNIVLAGAGGPVCASAMSLPPVALWTSMRIEDSLERGVSYFMAELQRLKRVVDAARSCNNGEARRLFYLLDEILQGTNNIERQIAARRIIMYLVHQGAIGAVSTHDLNLAGIPEVAAAANPIHFTETIRDTASGLQMLFDYKLRPGIANSTNALRLMQIVGLDLPQEWDS
ncbi:MAG: hypothetical protein IVW55_06670 [Chloroflexi bacterium]|nr:hypothetical protein [Chloroflexota bacterium]